MPIGFKVDNKIIKALDKYQYKELLSISELVKYLGISRDTYYRLRRDKSASPSTIKKIKNFLEEKGYL